MSCDDDFDGYSSVHFEYFKENRGSILTEKGELAFICQNRIDETRGCAEAIDIEGNEYLLRLHYTVLNGYTPENDIEVEEVDVKAEILTNRHMK